MLDLRSKIKLLSAQPLPIVLIATIILPLAFGAITGLALGWSIPLYALLLLLSVIGGVAAGYEHVSPISGWCRGACGATFFTTGLLAAHGMTGSQALLPLPEPFWVLPTINMIAGSVFGAVGGWSRKNAERLATA